MKRFIGIALLIGLLAGCTDPGSVSVAGTWELTGQYGTEKWVITDSTITYQSDYGSGYSTVYVADIVDFSNDGFNAGETVMTSGGQAAVNPGFAVIRYTQVNGAATGGVGEYNVFRWQDNAVNSTNRDFTQGYKAADLTAGNEDYTNQVFATAGAAEAGATVSNGYFAFASSGAEPQ